MPTDLEAIKARLSAATPGPWIHGDRWHIQGASHCPCYPEYGPLIHSGPMDINGEVMPSHVHEAPEPFWNRGIWQRPTAETEWAPEVVLIDEAATLLDADADLIAHAPTDIAALVVEVNRLRARDVLTTAVADAAREYRRSHNLGSQSCAECQALSAALDALNAGGDTDE